MSVSSVDRLGAVCQVSVAAGAVSTSTGAYPLNEIAPAVACIGTPPTKRGVQRQAGVTQGLDWLSFVAQGATLEELQEELAPGQEWTNLGRAGYGRENSWQCGHIKIYEGGPFMPFVVLSSKALRQLEAAGRVQSWRETLRSWVGFFPRYTRLDWAFDEWDGRLSLCEIGRKVDAGELTTRSHNFNTRVGGKVGSGQRRGQTIYLGERSSDTFVRFYDKAAEQNVEGPWVRVEIELKGSRADAAVERWLGSDDKIFAGILRAHVEFREVTGRSRMKNEAVSSWWSAFLGAALLVRLCIHRAVKRLDEVVEWVEKAVAPSLALVLEWSGGDLAALTGMVSRGLARWGPRHRWIAQEWAS